MSLDNIHCICTCCFSRQSTVSGSRQTTICRLTQSSWDNECLHLQGAKKIIFTACHSGRLKPAFTSPDVISTSPKNFWLAELISQFFCYSNSSKNITCPSGKLKTEFISPIAKSTSPGLSDTTFFARWFGYSANMIISIHTNWFLENHFFQCFWYHGNWRSRHWFIPIA